MNGISRKILYRMAAHKVLNYMKKRYIIAIFKEAR